MHKGKKKKSPGKQPLGSNVRQKKMHSGQFNSRALFIGDLVYYF